VDGLRAVQAQHLAAIELAEIDRLGDVGVGLSPALTDLVDHPGGQFEPAPPQFGRSLEQVVGALRGRHAAPGLERRVGALDRAIRQLDRRARHAPDDLLGVGRVDRVDRLVGRNPIAADDQRVGLAELGLDVGQRLPHGGGVLGRAEIGERLIAELRKRHRIPPNNYSSSQ